jgi:hypothetical protein
MVHGLRYAEEAERAARLLDEGEAMIRRVGERFAAFFIDHARAYWHYTFGSVATGSAHAGTGLAHVQALRADVTIAAFAAVAAELLVERDRLDEAAAIVDALDAGAIADTVSGAFAISARALVRSLQDRHADAEADARRAVDLLDERGWHAPMVSRARLRLARQLARRGEISPRLELLDAAEAVARAAGTDGRSARRCARAGRVVGRRGGPRAPVGRRRRARRLAARPRARLGAARPRRRPAPRGRRRTRASRCARRWRSPTARRRSSSPATPATSSPPRAPARGAPPLSGPASLTPERAPRGRSSPPPA